VLTCTHQKRRYALKILYQQHDLLMKMNIRVQLSAMMFLNFFIWGIWFVTMGTYLAKGTIAASGAEAGQAYGTQSWGAIIAPFIIGMIADRYFAAQKILGVLHIAGAALMYFISQQNGFAGFFPLLFIYMVVYMPTLALVNAIALKQVVNAEKEFSSIRVWGTIGWMVAGLVISLMAWEKNPADLTNTFKLAAAVSLALGIFSFSLPNTPPPKKGAPASSISEIIGLDALKILNNKNYLFFFIASVLICIPLAFYYSNANVFLNEVKMDGAAGKMVLGQASEAFFLFIMPLFFARFGVKQMLLIGMFAWVLRYLLFAFDTTGGDSWMLYLGIILHGICYDFFFVTGQIFTDQTAGEKVRSSAQGLITLATYGVGMYIGFMVAGNIVDRNKVGDAMHNWQSIWLFPCLFATGVALLFFLAFRNKNKVVAA
jgi:nucleoside transporter